MRHGKNVSMKFVLRFGNPPFFGCTRKADSWNLMVAVGDYFPKKLEFYSSLVWESIFTQNTGVC
jgi:hypothetical protein